MKMRIISMFLAVVMVLGLMPSLGFHVAAVDLEFKPIWPLDAYHINALDHYSGGTQHNGIDISANGGTEVRAVADGVVESIYNGCTHVSVIGDSCGSSWGNYVLVKHIINGTTYYSRYAHLTNNSITVTVGERVAVGQKVGLSGSSGSSSGYHLHLELYQGSRTAAKACQSFQYYVNNPSMIDGVSFSSHIPTSSVYYGDWVAENCEYSNGKYYYTHPDPGYLSQCGELLPSYGQVTITNACNPHPLPVSNTVAQEYGYSSPAMTDKALSVGDTVKVKIINIDPEKQKVGLTMKL